MLFNFEFDVTVFDVPVFDVTLLYQTKALRIGGYDKGVHMNRFARETSGDPWCEF